VKAGRARVAAAAADPTALDALLNEVGVGEWRRFYVAPHLAATSPGDLSSIVTLQELYWLGAGGAASPSSAAWGSSGFVLGGCQCLRIPPPIAWEGLAGRAGHPASYSVAPQIRLAELLTELRLPSVLARHILPVLMRDFLDQIRMVHSEDWGAVERFWSTLRRERVEDVVAELTVGGPLIAGEAR
jgi:hypothetical protein